MNSCEFSRKITALIIQEYFHVVMVLGSKDRYLLAEIFVKYAIRPKRLFILEIPAVLPAGLIKKKAESKDSE